MKLKLIKVINSVKGPWLMSDRIMIQMGPIPKDHTRPCTSPDLGVRRRIKGGPHIITVQTGNTVLAWRQQ